MSIAAYNITHLLSSTKARSSPTLRTEPYDIQNATAPHLEQIGRLVAGAGGLHGVRPATRSRAGQDRRRRRAQELATLGIGVAVLILVSAGVAYTGWRALKAKRPRAGK